MFYWRKCNISYSKQINPLFEKIAQWAEISFFFLCKFLINFMLFIHDIYCFHHWKYSSYFVSWNIHNFICLARIFQLFETFFPHCILQLCYIITATCCISKPTYLQTILNFWQFEFPYCALFYYFYINIPYFLSSLVIVHPNHC